ncbi:hypothetical protein H7171_03140 [Candidatus Saccharibacteria bacterium]|nr:hypothetical protein [Candidatus Saccharibacteria bacterium]
MNPQSQPVSGASSQPTDQKSFSNDVRPTTQNDVPNTAEDNDLIEKVWVRGAKDIVNKTCNDPHIQSKELNSYKAEYIKKRYGKDIKLSE